MVTFTRVGHSELEDCMEEEGGFLQTSAEVQGNVAGLSCTGLQHLSTTVARWLQVSIPLLAPDSVSGLPLAPLWGFVRMTCLTF